MPEHLHLLVYPGEAADKMSLFLQDVKQNGDGRYGPY